MSKKIILIFCLVIGLIIVGVVLLRPSEQKATLPNPLRLPEKVIQEKKPSDTLIEYQDPAGFSLNYPDNLSIEKNDIEDENIYADVELISKEVNGSLNLKIVDSKFKTLDTWVKSVTSTSQTPKEVKLGNLKAQEIKLSDTLLLGALDQGILFTIEIPLIEEKFWMKVYEQVLKDFSFASPESSTSQGQASSSEEVIFEGEEVVE